MTTGWSDETQHNPDLLECATCGDLDHCIVLGHCRQIAAASDAAFEDLKRSIREAAPQKLELPKVEVVVTHPKISFKDWVNSDNELLQQLIRALEEAHLPVHEIDDGVRFGYIPLNPIEFLATLRQAEALTEGRRFLDVGCGIGSKLYLARQLGWQVFGVELNPAYAQIARRLAPGAMIAECDAGGYQDYSAFDLVYAYRPAKDDTLCIGLEQTLIRAIRPGALLWLPDPRSGVIDLEQVAPKLWRKK